MESDPGSIIVTGSNGRIGTAVMRRFVGRFGTVIGFDRKSPNPPPPGCIQVSVEITSDENVRQALQAIREHHGARVASVVHLAAYYDFLGGPSPKYDETTVQGTRRLLRSLRELDFQVEQFIFSSTMLVHRPAEPGQFINEDWPIEATWEYPESKVQTEQVIREERGEISAVLMRIAGVYDDQCHSIPIAAQIKRIDEREFTSHVYSGSTAHGQSFLHMDDLVDAIEGAVNHRMALPPEWPVLVGEAEPLSYDELQHTLARLIRGDTLETVDLPKQLMPFEKMGAYALSKLPGADPFIRPWMLERANDHYALDITRARTLLGWEPKRSLRETLPKMVAALEADRLGWYRENNLEPPKHLLESAVSAKVRSVPTKASAEPMSVPVLDQVEQRSEHQGMAMPAPSAGSAMPVSGDAMAAQGPPWAHAIAAMILSVWLITSPFALNYRSAALTVSDVISGVLVISFAIVTLVRRSVWAPWASSLVGVWLLLAPLVFKAPTAAAFTNDTLVGVLVIAFVLLMPGMPGMRMLPGPDVPSGWSYSPSSWLQRAPIIVLALIAYFLTRQMAAFQLGYTRTVWEPFFSPGTTAVITSSISRSFPVSDAGLGAVAYLVEALMGFMGDKQRWRTMPWMVSFFGILVVPLGIASITLIILQPVAVGAWCTPCLFAALAMLIMIALTLDEVVAMVLFLIQARREGQSLWRTFWLGGSLAQGDPDKGGVHAGLMTAKEMVWGVAIPWNLLVSAAFGLWLMASPALFGTTDRAAHSDHLIGALVVTVAIIALADVGRAVRFINVAFGAWFLAAPWLLSGSTTASAWNDVAIGGALILLSVRRGPVKERYGEWQRFIR